MSETTSWAAFVAGAVLGSAVVASTAYAAYRYGQSTATAEDVKRVRRRARRDDGAQPASPRRALPPASAATNGGANGSANGSAEADAPLYRGNTLKYYSTASRDYEEQPPSSQRAGPAPSPASLGAPGPGSSKSRLPPLRVPSPPLGAHDVTESDYMTDTAPPLRLQALGSLVPAGSETDLAAGPGVTGAATRRASNVYAGPADRANPAAREFIRNQGFSFPTQHPAGPGMPRSGSGGSLRYPGGGPGGAVGPPGADGRPVAVAVVTAASGSPHATQLVVPSYPTAITAPAPPPAPPSGALTTADVMASEGRLIEDAAMHESYVRVITPEAAPTEETEEVCALLRQAVDLRRRWLFRPAVGHEELGHLPEAATPGALLGGDPFHWQPMDTCDLEFAMVDGVYQVYDPAGPGGRSKPACAPPGTATDFFSDMHWLLKTIALGHVRSFTHHRLLLLEQKFNLHVMLNADKEFLAQKSAPHRDFYNVRKVDTHVHHSACMHQKHLLRFIKSKLKKEADDVVIFRDGKYMTLKEVFESLNLTPYHLNVDTLDVHADKNIFHRFDKFNLKYNPFGQSRLREVFIKQDNLLHGRFLAQITQEVFNDLEASKYQHTEYRISVYGRKPVEWDTLAAWVVQNRLYSNNNVWMIQVPRLYNLYKEQGLLENFEQLLENIFAPLFEVTKDPNSHPQLHIFLKAVSGFDLVDDESKPERRPNKHMPAPRDWTTKHNPAYAYYTYYMYANLFVLNKMRESRGLNTFSLRPHSGEAGDIDHLVTTFLLAENIAHGINLRKSPSLQYLYYMEQIGLCMSPLSNNSLFLDYHRNPFPTFFARGLSVSLSTDDPLQIHLTKEPLVEEYSVAAQVWKLSSTDLCEVARNSVLHSGFPHQCKMHWVHTEYWRMGPEGNDIQKTNVPALRMRFRKDCYSEEWLLLNSCAAAHAVRQRAKEAAREAAHAADGSG